MSDLFDFSLRRPLHRQPELPESGRPREEVLAEMHAMATEEDAFWETGKCSGTDVLRRPRALRVPERGVRPVRPRERAAAGHVPERDQVRGRDHRDGARPDARRGGHRRRSRRAWSPPAAPADPARGARLPGAGRGRPAASPAPTSSSPRPGTRRSTRRATCSASSCASRRSTRRPRWSTSDAWPT